MWSSTTPRRVRSRSRRRSSASPRASSASSSPWASSPSFAHRAATLPRW
jgi:hypothetical protein